MTSSDRTRLLNYWYSSGHETINETNNAADQIIASPDRFLLNKSELFEAQGSYQSLALALGTGALGMAMVFGSSPRMATYFKNGQLKFLEWVCLGGTASIGYFGGNYVGQTAFGDAQRVHNHWMAYTFIKTQNRYEGQYVLSKAPTY